MATYSGRQSKAPCCARSCSGGTLMNSRRSLFALLLIGVAAAPAGADSVRTVQYMGTAQGSSPMINNLGEVAYTANITNPSLFRAMSEPGGVLSIAIATGNHAPGLPSGVNVSFPGNVFPDSTGRAGYSAYLQGSGVTSGVNDYA